MNNLKHRYDLLVLSPHLDDAALSCGGQIAQATASGQTVLIVTITAGDPPTGTQSQYINDLHSRWQLEQNAVAARRGEDMAACQILGADWLHWSVPDCIYRFHPQSGQPLYQSDADIFGEVHEAEIDLVYSLAAQMSALPSAQTILAPLTVGHHVDHLLTRAAAEQMWGNSLCYYEDYPYAQKNGALASVIEPAASDWRSEVIPLSTGEIARKIDAIAAFKSQLSTFWKSRDELERQVLTFSSQSGGERLWKYK